MPNNKNVLLATILSAMILILWTWFYEKPRMEKYEAEQKILAEQQQRQKDQQVANGGVVESSLPDLTKKTTNSDQNNSNLGSKTEIAAQQLVDRKEIIAKSEANRVLIKNDALHGSINLKGVKFDDLTLGNYRKTIDPKSDEVVLFSPSGSNDRYFADFGWISSEVALDLPGPDTIWQADAKVLTPQNPVTFSWKNRQNILFIIKVSIDENYMFSVSGTVKNLSKTPLSIASYGRVNRLLPVIHKSNYILHEGPIGGFDGILHETNYQKMLKEKEQSFQAKAGWIGLTDKYWLSSIIPDKKLSFQGKFSYHQINGNNIYDTQFIGQELKVNPGEDLEFTHHLFAGAKKIDLLDQYAKQYDIALFDRSVDFGWYYFLTKPFFFILKFLSNILGNYGLAILAMTVLVKLLMFPFANKSFGAIAKIKKLQPKIEKIREAHKDSKIEMNKQIMELYRKEKVNPASGCLPMLVQIPVFFALYKVLYITIDMRHAPFYGWIKDLSAPDPTSVFNLFGLLPFEAYGIFAIGVWPILMGLTMIIQQMVSPQIPDPVQAKVMKMLPYILIFVFAAFPAGLLIYWTWSNVLSIAQQYYINKRHA